MIQKLQSTDTVPFDVIETESSNVQPVISLIGFATIMKTVFQMKQKISLLNFSLQKAKPITVGIVCKPPDQVRFLEILSGSLNSIDLLSEEWHILWDLNINLNQNDSILGEENKDIIRDANKISSETKAYLEFCKNFGLKQIIKSPSHIQDIHPYRSHTSKYK